MNKKYMYLLVALVVVITSGWIYLKANSCKDMGCRVEAKCKGHLIPSSDTINAIKVNGTIVFVEYERDGVAQHDYDYYKNVDAAFFTKADEELIRNEGEAGGYTATVRVYKALKKGDTEIVFYKKPSMYQQRENDSTSKEPVKLATDQFHIE